MKEKESSDGAGGTQGHDPTRRDTSKGFRVDKTTHGTDLTLTSAERGQ